MDVKTYGRLAHTGDSWALALVPHVAIRVKRIFPRARADSAGVVRLKDTPEIAHDIEWLLSRWPLVMTEQDQTRLLARSSEHRETQTAVERILGGAQRSIDFPVEPARPGRDYQIQAADIALATGRLLCTDDVGLGKAQPLDANVLTPTGFRPMGDLAVGDEVIAADGTVTVVTAVHDQGELDCYEVRFSDGATTRCNDQHLWAARSSRSRNAPVLVRTLRSMIDGGLYNGKRQAKWHVPLAHAAELTSGDDLPIDPYLLGALLGDGGLTAKSVNFTTADSEVLAEVVKGLPAGVTARKTAGLYGYILGAASVGRTCSSSCDRKAVARGLCGKCYQRARFRDELPPLLGFVRHPLLGPLRDLGVMGHGSFTKAIPKIYMNASSKDRLALLQGLMDTDGTAGLSNGGRGCSPTFSSGSRQLASDVQWLARSLGGVARISSQVKGGKPHHFVVLKLPRGMNPFRLPRKADRLRDSRATEPTHVITSAERIGRVPMRCITIAHPSSLYVTDDFVVTHNSMTGLLVLRNPETLPALIVTLTHLPNQWLGELAKTFPGMLGHILRLGDVYDPADRHDGRNPDVIITSYSKLAKWQHHPRRGS